MTLIPCPNCDRDFVTRRGWDRHYLICCLRPPADELATLAAAMGVYDIASKLEQSPSTIKEWLEFCHIQPKRFGKNGGGLPLAPMYGVAVICDEGCPCWEICKGASVALCQEVEQPAAERMVRWAVGGRVKLLIEAGVDIGELGRVALDGLG